VDNTTRRVMVLRRTAARAMPPPASGAA
jgi:hypothetical protein